MVKTELIVGGRMDATEPHASKRDAWVAVAYSGKGVACLLRLLEVISSLTAIGKGAAQSWQMDTRCRKINEAAWQFNFVADALMRKDLAMCVAEARRRGVTLPVAALIERFCSEMQAAGRASNLLARLEGLT